MKKTVKPVAASAGKMETFWGQAPKSYDQAVLAALSLAKKSLKGKNLDWFETVEFRGGFEGGKPVFQVAVNVGYS